MNKIFEEHYKENYPKLFKLAYRLTGNHDDALDVVQESFIDAFNGWTSFRNECKPSTWLYRITVNRSLKYIKKRKRLPIIDITEKLNISQNDFYNMLSTNENIENNVILETSKEYCLQMFVKCMPSKQRITFTLRIILDLSVNETAFIMGISKEAVKINLYRARKQISENMNGRCSLLDRNNPCSCSIWIDYYKEKGLIEKFSSIVLKPKDKKEFNKQISDEILFITKLKLLYSYELEIINYNDFYNDLKKIINKKSLKILS